MMPRARRHAFLVLALLAALEGATGAQPRPTPVPTPTAARVDAYVAKPRLFVLTDIANEPDDQMSLVRLLVYSNQFDVEGLVATTSTWLKQKPRPDVIRLLLDAYEQVHPSLSRHAPGFPAAATLRTVVATGQQAYGMADVATGRSSAGSDLLVRAALRDDPRPLWVSVWGGANTLAQALTDLRAKHPSQLAGAVAKLRVYSISDQDDAGPWIRREFPELFYVALPSPPNGEQYSYATWTGISGDRFYRNGSGADFSTFADEWVDANVRAKGPLGKHYPFPCCIHEGDTPSFLGLVDNGLASAMSPSFGGWGGRYVWRQFYGEPRALWTQGGDAYPGNDNSQDTVTGTDGQPRTSDQATIWRWRTAFQHDFAARMDWTVKPVSEANHNPDAVVNGQAGRAPIAIAAQVGQPVTLDATGTTDPDGHALAYRWFFYPEAGTGIPGQPVFAGTRFASAPSPDKSGPPALLPRVVVEPGASDPSSPGASRATVVPRVAGTAHVILAVEDAGTPSLTSYRRIILTIR